jgi:hypothetical protein
VFFSLATVLGREVLRNIRIMIEVMPPAFHSFGKDFSIRGHKWAIGVVFISLKVLQTNQVVKIKSRSLSRVSLSNRVLAKLEEGSERGYHVTMSTFRSRN